MSRNGDIRGFFSKKPPPSNTSSQVGPTSSSQPSLNLPSSPITPPRAQPKAPLTRDDEIRGSDDDDDDDSDGSLESLSEIIGRRTGGPAFQRDRNPNAIITTPKAKRVASASHQPKPPKHKFDLKSLVDHAKQDEVTEASVRRAEALLQDMPTEQEQSDDEDSLSRMKKTAKELVDGEDQGSRGDQIVMAMDRTQGDESRPRCYFFNLDGPPHDVPRRPFPEEAVIKEPWTILADAETREQMFIHGMPTVLAAKGKELPDELFEWILDEMCVEKNLQLRIQYINVLALCRNKTRRLVDGRQLYEKLERLGGPKYSVPVAKFELSPGLQSPYSGRDWSILGYFLQLLTRMAPNLASETATSAVQMLLRMGLDPIVSDNVRVRVEHSKAMVGLISALPTAEKQWNTCCEKICAYLYAGVEYASQRIIAINHLPTSIPRSCELRRRLASAALFRDPNRGAEHPDYTVTMHDLLTRLADPDFQVNHSTDFNELNALISLLDIIVDDGTHLRPRSPGPDPDIKHDAKYDADIDRLSGQLKYLHDKINDNNLIARKDAKAALDAMNKRLKYQVRTRAPPKSSIFGLEPKEDHSLPRQRDFMKNWKSQKQVEKKTASSEYGTPLGSDE